MYGKSVNIYCSEMTALSRKPSRSNFTNPYSIRVYNLSVSILRESRMLIFIQLTAFLPVLYGVLYQNLHPVKGIQLFSLFEGFKRFSINRFRSSDRIL